MCKASLDATICSRLLLPPLKSEYSPVPIKARTYRESKLEHNPLPKHNTASSSFRVELEVLKMKDLFFTISPESNGSGRAAICRDPLNVAGSTIWSHTITNHDRRNGAPSIVKVCEIAFNALRKGKTPAQASKEAGV